MDAMINSLRPFTRARIKLRDYEPKRALALSNCRVGRDTTTAIHWRVETRPTQLANI